VYVEGDTVEVSALPACGYIFVKWIGDVEDSTDQNTQIVMTGNQEIRAVFESIKVTLTMHADPEKGGTIEPTTGKHNYLVGDTVHIAAVPNEGYEFVKWKGGIADSLSSETDFVIIESKTITALFSELDLIPPELKNCFPVPKAASVPKNTQIKFTAQDKQTGVNLGTLQAWVNEFQIIANGLDQTGGLIDIHEKEKGYKITYRPSEDFEEGIGVTVRALFSDLASPPNSCDSSYVFHVGKSQADTSKVQEVGQAGGTVQDSTSGIEIHIPENALEDSVEISISKVDEPPPLPLGVTGLALTHHFGPDGLHFNNAVVIQIPYTQSDLDSARVTHPEDLRLFYFHTATGIWEEIDVDSVDVIRQLLFIHVEEFCYFTFGVERGQTTDVSETQTNLPKTFGLMQNYPNPFNPETAIGFDVPEPSPVKITVYNISGRIIRTLVDEKKSPGHFTVLWDGRNQQGNMVSTGIYFYVMKAGDRVFVKKMSFVK
jgi:hypothetical protein